MAKEKKDKLILKWSKKERDLVCHYPSSADGSLTFGAFTSKRHHPLPFPHGVWDGSFVEELKKRGYDITTLKFSVEKYGNQGK